MKVVNRGIGIICACMMSVAIVGCSGTSSSESQSQITIEAPSIPAASTESTEDTAKKEIPEGMYISELTGEPISKEIEEQRPIAVMIDNERTALDHAGTAKADVVYEMINSTANDRITRFMCIFKDWKNIEQIGSIRSTRQTNCLLFQEWNAVLCHDGGPFYIDDLLANEYSPHFSGTFARIQNGKPAEFTEYITNDEEWGSIQYNFENSNISETYDKYRLDDLTHFNFCDWGETVSLKDDKEAFEATKVDLIEAFRHNSSRLDYNEKTETYDYSEYGEVHKDLDTEEVLTFKNVILQKADFEEMDPNGYMIYYIYGLGMQEGYYITDGYAKKIYWNKTEVLDHTRYYEKNASGDYEEITINTGKTYIGLIPADSWDDIAFK